ncbi:MAG: folate family ECF transporter S component [Clostridia bacterium]|nr:folate family ECF transporter S component [Clostridia bacterium]
MQKQDLSNAKLYSHSEYWRDAMVQLFDVRILCAAAILIALRVVLKSVQFPVGPELNVQIGFFVNALGATIFGPVVAIIAAAITDTLGCIFFPTGPYFFPFIFVEIAGSLIFALLLWRRKLSATRIIISRFLVVVVCNFILNPSLLIIYYQMFYNGKAYEFITVPRVMKNIALFPVEALLLVLFLGAMIPALVKLKIVPKAQDTVIKLKKKHYILLAVLLVLAILIVGVYYSFYLPTQPKSVSQESENKAVKLTLRTEQRTYDSDEFDIEAPLPIKVTLKNQSEDAVIDYVDGWYDIALVDADGTAIPAELVGTEGSFVWQWMEATDIPDGKYTAKATVNVTVNGEPVELSVEYPIKIK